MIHRRDFLRTAPAWPLLPGLMAAAVEAPSSPLRAAVIGHTGRGDYGHGLDRIFRGRPGIVTVAVADPVEAGRLAAQERSGAARAYADYREMLAREKPHLVSIGMRHSDQHQAVVLDCLRAGAHCYLEKPMTPGPLEAFELCAEADRRGLALAVAHTMRLAPVVVRLTALVAEGALGELAEIRAHGKQDARAGGEDLVVLGTHLFDLMRLFAGDPESVTARITVDGRPITRSDRRRVRDEVGWLAGDRVFATFAFARGVVGTFSSDVRLRTTAGPWGLELRGTRGTARLFADLVPRVSLQTGTADAPWQPLAVVPAMTAEAAQNPPVDDWLEAVRSGVRRRPACDGRNGAWAVRMAAGVFRAALERRAVDFRDADLPHPLDDPRG